MKNSVRRGLFHPDDLKILGLSSSGGPLSAPLPNLSRKASRPALSPLTPPGIPTTNRPAAHVRSSSFVGPGSANNSGSFGRSEARRINSQNEFDKYTEEDDEDYEDVFGKPNGNSEFDFFLFFSF
jgi:hypothetical protein